MVEYETNKFLNDERIFWSHLLKSIRKGKLSQFCKMDRFFFLKYFLKWIAHENWSNDRIHMKEAENPKNDGICLKLDGCFSVYGTVISKVLTCLYGSFC